MVGHCLFCEYLLVFVMYLDYIPSWSCLLVRCHLWQQYTEIFRGFMGYTVYWLIMTGKMAALKDSKPGNTEKYKWHFWKIWIPRLNSKLIISYTIKLQVPDGQMFKLRHLYFSVAPVQTFKECFPTFIKPQALDDRTMLLERPSIWVLNAKIKWENSL